MITPAYIEDLLTQARRVPYDPADPQIGAILGAVGMSRAERLATLQRLLDAAALEATTPEVEAAARAAAAEVAAMG